MERESAQWSPPSKTEIDSAAKSPVGEHNSLYCITFIAFYIIHTSTSSDLAASRVAFI